MTALDSEYLTTDFGQPGKEMIVCFALARGVCLHSTSSEHLPDGFCVFTPLSPHILAAIIHEVKTNRVQMSSICYLLLNVLSSYGSTYLIFTLGGKEDVNN